jgi:hypothetical protein
MVIAKQFRSMQSMLPRISSKLTKDIPTAKDNLYVMSERECDEIMEKTNQYAGYLEENTGYGVYYST